MAERISQDVTPPKIGPDAHEELEALLQTLHEHGVLRFANDVVAANTEIARILVDGLSKEGSLNAVQNISVMAMVLATIPPDRFYHVMFAIKEGIYQASSYHRDGDNGSESGKGEAPGLSGVYKLLHDEELWHAIQPLLAGLKAFSERLDQPIDKPVSDFTGKPTEGP
ncbi:MAG: DUF1641 domain-containing protein [Halomonas sp.]|nr:DUF1641 domain-containing protein [Halomonas sp.]TVP51085.1 MAG: DUF1641 domain-containing protein [Halomonas sp.]